MSIYDCSLWISDIDEIIARMPDLRLLENRRVMITGCSGLICSAVIDILIRWNETHKDKIHILAAGRNKNKVIKRFYPYTEKGWFIYEYYDATSLVCSFPEECDYIIHGAGNASPSKIMKEPVETMTGNFIGLKNLLDFARDNNTQRLLYISSSEVYGKKETESPYKEFEYGYIDILMARNSYSMGKRAAETLCVSFAEEYKVETVIVRPGHVYGPTADINDNRVSSKWVYDAAMGDNIIMKSEGKQVRSYCYCLDCASAILTVLFKGINKQAYNISNPRSVISIRDVAEILTRYSGVLVIPEGPTEEEKNSFNPMINSSLNCCKLLQLGWEGVFDAERGFAHTVEILKNILKN